MPKTVEPIDPKAQARALAVVRSRLNGLTWTKVESMFDLPKANGMSAYRAYFSAFRAFPNDCAKISNKILMAKCSLSDVMAEEVPAT